MDNEIVLAASGLRAGYGGKPVLQGMDFEVRKGEIVAVIGRNGVGKSTLMKTIIGLVPTMDGTMTFGGVRIEGLMPHQRARVGIGYVPQGRDVFPRLTVAENLEIGGVPRGGVDRVDRERVLSYFPILKERWSQRAGFMSGGQQQQLAIARVMVANPQLVLLDEPSEGIQPNVVQSIARVMSDLNRTIGLTVVLVEQNIDMIRAMAQRCYVMDKGRVVAELSRDELSNEETMRRHLAV